MLQGYPFTRLVVFNSISGVTYIQWDLDYKFHDTGNYKFQLQVSRSPNRQDCDWEDVGSQHTNPAYLSDDTTPSYGYRLDKYYRIILDTSNGHYVSAAFGCFGQLKPREWHIAREIRRKERLRYGYTAVPVTILQKKRYGERCPVCTSTENSGSSNSKCEYCYGTGYLGGYNTPFRMQMMDISPSQLHEIHYSNNAATFNTSEDRYQARASGIPELYEGDIIIDLSTDQRFKVYRAPVVAQIHRVPLVRQLDMYLLPYSDISYGISSALKQVTIGCGSVEINQDYGTTSALVYVDSKNVPIEGATVKLLDSNDNVLYTTKTGAEGIWLKSFSVDPGTYTIEFTDNESASPTRKTVVIPVSKAQQEESYVENTVKSSLNYLTPFS